MHSQGSMPLSDSPDVSDSRPGQGEQLSPFSDASSACSLPPESSSKGEPKSMATSSSSWHSSTSRGRHSFRCPGGSGSGSTAEGEEPQQCTAAAATVQLSWLEAECGLARSFLNGAGSSIACGADWWLSASATFRLCCLEGSVLHRSRPSMAWQGCFRCAQSTAVCCCLLQPAEKRGETEVLNARHCIGGGSSYTPGQAGASEPPDMRLKAARIGRQAGQPCTVQEAQDRDRCTRLSPHGSTFAASAWFLLCRKRAARNRTVYDVPVR